MNDTQSWKERHANAMLNPVMAGEKTVVALYTELARIADRHSGDNEIIPVVEQLGAAIVRLTSMASHDLGNLDPGLINKQVHDVVERAGGNTDEL